MEIALIYISIKNNMDTQTIVKGLINEYIKPKYPIYKVEYVEIEQVYCEEDDGDSHSSRKSMQTHKQIWNFTANRM